MMHANNYEWHLKYECLCLHVPTRWHFDEVGRAGQQGRALSKGGQVRSSRAREGNRAGQGRAGA
jgi:hypothetical protein